MNQAVNLYGEYPDSVKRIIEREYPGLKVQDRSVREAGEDYVLTFPQVADGGSGLLYRTTIIVINNGGANAKGRIILRRQNGEPMLVNSNQGSGSQFDFQLGPGETQLLETDGKNPLQIGWAEVRSDVELSGTGIFTVSSGPSADDFVSSVGIGDSIPTTRAMVFIDTTESKGTGIAISNPSDSKNANLNYELRRLNGNLVASNDSVLEARSQKAEFVTEIFKGVDLKNFRGTLIVDSDTPLSVVTLRTRGANFTSLPAVLPAEEEEDEEDDHELHFARIADGSFGGLDITTGIVLMNNSGLEVTGQLEFFNANGKPLTVRIGSENNSQFEVTLPPSGAVELKTRGANSPGQVGWARFTSDKPLGGGASFTMKDHSSGGFISEVGVPASIQVSKPELFVREVGSIATGVGLTNPGEIPVNVQFRLTGKRVSGAKSDGEEIISEVTRSLPSKQHLGLFVSELFSHVPAVKNGEFEGRLEIEAQHPSYGEGLLYPLTGVTLLSQKGYLTSAPLANFIVNFGPSAELYTSTLMAESEPAVCIRTRQLTGEAMVDSAVYTLSEGTFDFEQLEDTQIYGNFATEVLGIQFIGRMYTTEISGNSATFFSCFTDDGLREAQPFVGTITNLSGGGVEIRMDTNTPVNDAVVFTSVMDFCIDPGLLKLPTSGGFEFKGQFQSRVDSEVIAPMTSIRTAEFAVENAGAGNPRILHASDHRVKGGQELEIFGRGFSSTPAGNKVTVQGKSRIEATVLEASVSRLLVRLPQELKSGPLRVEIGGKQSNDYQLEVIFAPKVGLELTAEVNETLSGLDISFEQQPGELGFYGASLNALGGEWVTTGFIAGKEVGILELDSEGQKQEQEMIVRSNDGDLLVIDSFEPGDDDPSYVIEIRKTEKALKISTYDLDYTSEIKVPITIRVKIEQPVYSIPAGKFAFDVSCNSMPERNQIMGTSVVTKENREIQR